MSVLKESSASFSTELSLNESSNSVSTSVLKESSASFSTELSVLNESSS